MNLQNGQQIYFNVNQSENFDLVQELRRGDLIRITRYEDFVTRTGEPTWRIFSFDLVARGPLNLPLVLENEDGVYNQIGAELQRQNRVLNWLVNPRALTLLQERSRITRYLRTQLEDAGAMEVETPMLQPQYGGASANPFVTRHQALDREFFLRISPELYLKRLVVAGLPFIYEMNRCFRNEGMDRNHNPEFTLLEFYRADADWNWGMEFTEQLIGTLLNVPTPFARLDFRESIQALGYNLEELSPAQMDEIFSERVEPGLVEPTFVCRHPVAMSPLAYSSDGIVADRFELYLQGMEIANGYSEQHDAVEQRRRMEEMGNVDEDYLQALEYGMPPTCGVGIGIDRLVMVATQTRNIRDIIAFPA